MSSDSLTSSNNTIKQEDNNLSKKTIKRLAKDVADIYKNPLTENGIYYYHDDENMRYGYALIIGPKNTPYENGLYFFRFKFTSNYPFSPPIVTYLTNDGVCRFHPNMYRSGKVCLSILNTWKGEGWTSCQNIKSVLLVLVSVLDENPILHEPGVNKEHPSVPIYNAMISMKNISYSIMSMIQKIILDKTDNTNHNHNNSLETNTLSIYKLFTNDVRKHFIKNKELIKNQIKALQLKYKHYQNSNNEYKVIRYSMQYNISFQNFEKEWDNMIKQF